MAHRVRILFVLAFGWFLSGPVTAQEVGQPQSLPTTPLEIISGDSVHVFEVEVASTREQMTKGLMFRTEMNDNHGMIFNYSPPRPASMWMKNTYIPLDILFIEANGKILNIVENTTPFSLASISSSGPVAASLELNAGVVSSLGIVPGDVVRHELFGNTPDDAS